MSASTPQIIDPSTVPIRAEKGTSETVALVWWYSLIMPGIVEAQARRFHNVYDQGENEYRHQPPVGGGQGRVFGGVTTMS